jgi:beta-glucosidase-like glycosyl hydrolase
MLKGMASAFLVLLLFGVALGAALFRPVAQSPVPDALTVPEAYNLAAGGQDQVETTNSPPADIESMPREIEEEQTALEEEQVRLARGWEDLKEEQAHIAQEWENLQAEQARLAQEWENLQAEQARLNQEWEDLQAARVRIDEERGLLRETEARLQRKEANLAELEQKIEGRLRLSVVAAVISGLLAVPSVLFFVALMRQGPRTPDKKEFQRAQASQTHQRKRVTQYGRPVTVTPASTYSDNGRDKESIEALHVKGR